MLLTSLVLGRIHFQSVTNSHYLDPSPAVQRAWSDALGSPNVGVAAAGIADGSSGSSGGSMNSGSKSSRPGTAAAVFVGGGGGSNGSVDTEKVK